MNVSAGGSNPLEQIAMSAIKRAHDQQDVNGQNALKLIQSAAPEQLHSSQPTQIVGETTGANIDTYA